MVLTQRSSNTKLQPTFGLMCTYADWNALTYNHIIENTFIHQSLNSLILPLLSILLHVETMNYVYTLRPSMFTFWFVFSLHCLCGSMSSRTTIIPHMFMLKMQSMQTINNKLSNHYLFDYCKEKKWFWFMLNRQIKNVCFNSFQVD